MTFLSRISENLYQKDLFKILTEENEHFTSVGRLDNYIIQNLIDMDEMEKMKKCNWYITSSNVFYFFRFKCSINNKSI